MLESHIQADIRITLGKLRHTRLLRNSKGQGWMGKLVSRDGGRVVLENARQVAMGLIAPGSSDLVGPVQVVITPAMVGQTIAVFAALEIKRPGIKPEQEQTDFVTFVRNFGGIGEIVHSPDEAARAVCRFPWETGVVELDRFGRVKR
jgi:hypothetical protein